MAAARSSEIPETKRRFRNLLDVSGAARPARADRARPRPTRRSCACTAGHLAGVARRRRRGGDAGDGTPFGPRRLRGRALAAGGPIAAVDAVLDGACRQRVRARAARPATTPSRRGDGFCLFGNIAHRRPPRAQARGVARVAVVDWDVHHGNGTQTALLRDPDVLTISLHQDGLYPPGRGRVTAGEGAGAAPTSTSRCPRAAARRLPPSPSSASSCRPRAFRPELIFVACGFDASAYDPLGRMDLGADDYRA